MRLLSVAQKGLRRGGRGRSYEVFMILLYGANGYTGELIARRARGEKVVLAGRNADALAKLGAELGLEHRAFPLEDAEKGIDGATVVLHCAGPFSHTSKLMVDACLK